jgi:predicted nucleic acid-binding protein
MGALIDTNVAIHMRDRDPTILDRVKALGEVPKLSIISRIELEGSVHSQPQFAAKRRAALDILVFRHEFLDFDAACADAYRAIVSTCGFSRSRTLDRMIAATAIVHDLTLITLNGDDFRAIPGLKLDIW